MRLILLSGGSGKRLWPLSNDTRSKQFLKILETQSGEKISMVQRVWRQIKKAGLSECTVIATSEVQKEMIFNQLGEDVPTIIEPDRRDTFPAITLSVSYLYSQLKVNKDEVVVVLPVDPYVDDDFFIKIKELETIINKSKADLALMGVQPTYPSSKFGYIVPEGKKRDFFSVSHFIEKPSEEVASSLIENNALWNCGVFAFKLGYLLDILKEKNIDEDFVSLINNYSELPKISFDYEVVEEAKNIIALPYTGNWKDLGTWNSLTEEMMTKQIGKGVLSEDSHDTHLINELDIPVTILGANNLIVAASPDGILISDKKASPRLKEIIKDFNAPPMYEERIWGWSRTLDYSKYEDDKEMVTKRICIVKGKNSTYHYHKFRDEVWTIVKGEGELVLDDYITRIKSGDVVHIPFGKKHGVKAISDLEFIEVQTGTVISNEDVIRLSYKWEEIVEFHKKSKSIFIS